MVNKIIGRQVHKYFLTALVDLPGHPLRAWHRDIQGGGGGGRRWEELQPVAGAAVPLPEHPERRLHLGGARGAPRRRISTKCKAQSDVIQPPRIFFEFRIRSPVPQTRIPSLRMPSPVGRGSDPGPASGQNGGGEGHQRAPKLTGKNHTRRWKALLSRYVKSRKSDNLPSMDSLLSGYHKIRV